MPWMVKHTHSHSVICFVCKHLFLIYSLVLSIMLFKPSLNRGHVKNIRILQECLLENCLKKI